MNLPKSDEILVSITAATDAIWLPNRELTNCDFSTCLHERRCEFESHGVVWTGLTEGDNADRKATQRALAELAAGGLVEVFRAQLKTTHAKPTHEGDERARALVGLPTMKDARAFYTSARTIASSPLGDEHGEFLFCCEYVLAGLAKQVPHDEAKRILFRQEEFFLPLAWRGLAQSDTTNDRRAYLGVRAKADLPAPAKKLPKKVKGVWEFYDRTLANELSKLRTAKPAEPREIIGSWPYAFNKIPGRFMFDDAAKAGERFDAGEDALDIARSYAKRKAA